MSAVTFGPPLPVAQQINGGRSPDWDGLLAWSDEPGLAATTYQPPSGFLFATKSRAVKGAAAASTLSAKVRVMTAGAGLTGVYAALYRASDNVQLAVSTDQSAAFNAATGLLSVPLLVSVPVVAGDYIYLSLLCVGTTVPVFVSHLGSNVINTFSIYRGYVSGLTLAPSTLPALTPNVQAVWMAVQ